MSFQHPSYPHLLVVDGQAGEVTKAGAFYRPKKTGETLSWLASRAYGSGAYAYYQIINQSPWNRANCVRGSSSSDCSPGSRVQGDATGFVRLCFQADKGILASKGNPDNLVWIPPYDTRYDPDTMPKPEEAPSKPMDQFHLTPGAKPSTFLIGVKGGPKQLTLAPGGGGGGKGPASMVQFSLIDSAVADAQADLMKRKRRSPWPMVGGVLLVVVAGVVVYKMAKRHKAKQGAK